MALAGQIKWPSKKHVNAGLAIELGQPLGIASILNPSGETYSPCSFDELLPLPVVLYLHEGRGPGREGELGVGDLVMPVLDARRDGTHSARSARRHDQHPLAGVRRAGVAEHR